jgi:hypothetical protein
LQVSRQLKHGIAPITRNRVIKYGVIQRLWRDLSGPQAHRGRPRYSIKAVAMQLTAEAIRDTVAAQGSSQNPKR